MKLISRDRRRHELDVLKRIAKDTHAKECIIELFGDFELSHGDFRYSCLVLETLWQSINGLCKAFESHELLLVAKYISCRIMRGLEALNRLGVIHNGNCRIARFN